MTSLVAAMYQFQDSGSVASTLRKAGVLGMSSSLRTEHIAMSVIDSWSGWLLVEVWLRRAVARDGSPQARATADLQKALARGNQEAAVVWPDHLR